MTENLARPAGLEPATTGLEGGRIAAKSAEICEVKPLEYLELTKNMAANKRISAHTVRTLPLIKRLPTMQQNQGPLANFRDPFMVI